jgi:hypothetical protein
MPSQLQSARLSRVDVDADDAVLSSGALLGRAAEALEAFANRDLLEACGAQDVDELCTRQSASDSTSPEIHVFS